MMRDSLGDRMKGVYENVWSTRYPGRMPLIIRVDGRTFHTYTKGLKRPWDANLDKVMDATALALCSEIQGAQLAYIQSDEISILVHNYKTFDTQAWMDNKVQKILSLSASIASSTFTSLSWMIWDREDEPNKAALIRPAQFDSRAFVLPEGEVCNAFLWRQQDATRNSIQMLARSLYSHKELHGKNRSDLQEMCFQKGHNWNDLPTRYKRGRCAIRDADNQRQPWVIDEDIPVFSENRDYINKLLAVVEE